MRTRVPVLVGLATALLLTAWTMSSPPFSSPDEASHYLRALSIANGTLVGPRAPVLPDDHTAAQLAWAAHDARGVLVPGKLSPPSVPCTDGRPHVDGRTCLETTVTGDYHPLPYLLPAAALLVSHDASTGLWLSRAASALESLVFIVLAIALASSGRGFPLLGLLAGLTPMVLFVCSVVNPNGLEVAASLAFLAGLLRLTRDPAGFPRWGWVALAVSGAVVILAWQLGPVFVVLDLLVCGGLLKKDGLAAVAASHRRAVQAVGATLAAALIVYLVYGLSSGAFHSQVGLRPVLGSVRAGFDALGPALKQAVGVFGSLTVMLPRWMYWAWWAMAGSLCLAPALVGPRRNRMAYAAIAIGALAFPVLFYGWVYRHSGFRLQGRYVLPVFVLLPLAAGEVLERTVGAGFRGGLRAAIAGIAAFQLVAWWINARAAAGRPHDLFFQHHALWSPPLGWWPWTAAAAAGAALLLSSVVLTRPAAIVRSPRRSGAQSAPTSTSQRAPAPPA